MLRQLIAIAVCFSMANPLWAANGKAKGPADAVFAKLKMAKNTKQFLAHVSNGGKGKYDLYFQKQAAQIPAHKMRVLRKGPHWFVIQVNNLAVPVELPSNGSNVYKINNRRYVFDNTKSPEKIQREIQALLPKSIAENRSLSEFFIPSADAGPGVFAIIALALFGILAAFSRSQGQEPPPPPPEDCSVLQNGINKCRDNTLDSTDRLNRLTPLLVTPVEAQRYAPLQSQRPNLQCLQEFAELEDCLVQRFFERNDLQIDPRPELRLFWRDRLANNPTMLQKYRSEIAADKSLGLSGEPGQAPAEPAPIQWGVEK